ncbi:MAG TPA: DUF11 domain-containing protein [Gaiellaceae bacterium]
MRRRLVLTLLLAALAAVAATAQAASPPASAVLKCRAGFKHAVIAGKQQCLRRGQRCRKRYDRQYHRYGFHCHTGRLTQKRPTPKPAPPPPPPPAPPPAPAPAADLSVIESHGPEPVTVGDDLRYTVVVENKGPDAAEGVRVTITIPLGAALFAEATQGTCTGTTTVLCDLGTVAAGGTPSATVALRPTEPGTLTSTATVTATTADPNSADNIASSTATVLSP